MSKEAPTPQEAQDIIFRDVYAPSFFQKLASYKNPITGQSFSPSSDEEAAQYLRLAAKVRNGYTAEQVKRAGDNSSLLAELETNLDRTLQQQYGHSVQQNDPHLKQACLDAVKTPEYQALFVALQPKAAAA